MRVLDFRDSLNMAEKAAARGDRSHALRIREFKAAFMDCTVSNQRITEKLQMLEYQLDPNTRLFGSDAFERDRRVFKLIGLTGLCCFIAGIGAEYSGSRQLAEWLLAISTLGTVAAIGIYGKISTWRLRNADPLSQAHMHLSDAMGGLE